MRRVLWLFCVVLLLAGFQENQDIPTKIEKVDLKLMRDEIAVTFVDLPDGEATVIQNDEGKAILINTGNENSKEHLKKTLDLYGVTSIEKVILTKLGPDYQGNLEWLLKEYPIQKIIIPSSVDKEELGLNAAIEKWNIGKKELFSDIVINVLQVMDQEKSMNFSMKFGEHRFLFMGVASKLLEEQLIKSYPLKDVNILKVAEFASNNGTSQELLEAVDPQIAIIFQKKKLYPSADVLERLQNTWIDIYYSKQFGNVTIRCSKETYEVITLTVESINSL
ncbi:ComEC/Rec2 family competence protein [Bacillus sp. AK128]